MSPLMGKGLLLALLVLALDMASKWLAVMVLVDHSILLVPGFFDFTLAYNKGAAFSLFKDLPNGLREGFLISIAVVAGVIIINILRQTDRFWEAISMGLILGGAVGNLIDRVRLGQVVDFIHLHWHDLSWPIFNVADSAISVGVGLLLWDTFRKIKSAEAAHL